MAARSRGPARVACATLAALVLAGCTSGRDAAAARETSRPQASGSPKTFPAELAVRGPDEAGLSPRERPYSLPLNNPGFVPAAQAGHMQASDLVVGIDTLGRSRAYPWWIVKNYHLVNDTLVLTDAEASRTPGAVRMQDTAEWKTSRHPPYLPLLITFCESCAGAGAFVPVVNGRPLVFNQVRSLGSWTGSYYVQGTYTIADLQTHSRWHPFTGLAGSGPLAGTRLRRLPAFIASWKEWVAEHPDTLVVLGAEELREREHSARPRFDLERDIRALHTTVSDLMKNDPERLDDRLPRNELVVGLGAPDGGKAMALPLSQLRSQGGFVQLEFDGEPYLFVLHGRYQTAVYSRRLDSTELRFRVVSREPFRFADQTGTSWDITGRAVSGPRLGRSLELAPDSYLTAWVEWSLAHPDCEIVTAVPGVE